MQLACKDEQVSLLKAVVTDSGDELQATLVSVAEERAALRAQLTKQQHCEKQSERRSGQQLEALMAALAQANARLQAGGGKPVAVHKNAAGGGGVADQGTPAAARRAAPSVQGPRSPDTAEEGPPTPLSPGQAPKAPGSSWDGSEGPMQPVQCLSPLRFGGKGAGAADDDEEEEPLDSPRSDLSGPSCCGADDVGAARASRGGFDPAASPPRAAGRGMTASAAFAGSRLARDNPLFRCSGESARRGGARGALASVDGGSVLHASLASLDEASAMSGGGAAAFGLAQAQLEIQVGCCAAFSGVHCLCSLQHTRS
jgi:hypothetical protein